MADINKSFEMEGLMTDEPTIKSIIENSFDDDAQSPELDFDPIEESINHSTILMRDVEWNGHLLKIFPLDYQKVPMVKYQIVACFLMFAVFGFNDQSMGSLLPTLVDYYDVSKIKVSNLFLIQLFGYICASLLNERIHSHWGMKGGMLVASTLCLVFFSILLTNPSNFYTYMICCFPLGLGIGILDASCNVLMGNLLVHKNELMGIMHAVYGGAAMLTPPLVAHFVEWGHWSLFFIIPFALSVMGTCLIIPSFRYETAVKYEYTCQVDLNDDDMTPPSSSSGEQEKESFLQLFSRPAIFLYALFLFLYLGAEITTGAWFYTFLLETKSPDQIKMSYVASTFWIGLTAGRLILAFITKRAFANEYRACRVYSILTVFFYTLFVLVGSINSDSTSYLVSLSIIMFCSGFFIGPLFPSASIVAVQVLPKNLQISGVGIAVALGGCGGALFPYTSGILTHLIGVKWIPILCWIMVSAFTVVWAVYPRFIKGYEEFL